MLHLIKKPSEHINQRKIILKNILLNTDYNQYNILFQVFSD